MWVDQDGVAHTVALPEPSDVMDEQFVASMAAFDESEREVLLQLLEEAEERLLAENLADLAHSPEYVGSPPPRELLAGPTSSPVDVLLAVERIELRWRLDVVLALPDHLD